jgi:hypothetical protein
MTDMPFTQNLLHPRYPSHFKICSILSDRCSSQTKWKRYKNVAVILRLS